MRHYFPMWLPEPEASRLANDAGGIVVMKHATATVASTELASAIREDAGA